MVKGGHDKERDEPERREHHDDPGEPSFSNVDPPRMRRASNARAFFMRSRVVRADAPEKIET